ncbi:M16 family metallopeptidase [Thioalkalivibrio sp. HK1]|uniref:M16 family metallopeptidase n=1 Tax=Thioalkalivibrio sp. HK1 TaxID=1469245 RepID=UPI00046E73D5|nr:pitrilysin family protein [Thioalkalivibrio sp. HK1]
MTNAPSRGILTELPNGLKVATHPMPHAKSLFVGVWVNAGARDERDSEAGIAHMLEHIAFKGTKSRTARDIAIEVENVGGDMNAHTGREETAYHMRLLPEHLDMGIDILADILTNPTMPEDEIERERGVIIQEIGQALDEPDDLLHDLFARAAYGEHTLGRPILGSVDNIKAFSRDDLTGFMNRHYGSGQMLVVASGAVDHEDFVRRVEAKLGGLENAENAERITPKWHGGRSIEARDHLEQMHILVGLPAFGAYDERRYALSLFSTILGGGMSSRLFQEVREKRGLCYTIFSYPDLYSDSGHFSIYSGTSAEQVNEMLAVTAEQIVDLADGVSADELERVKTQVRSSMVMSRESVQACGRSLAGQILRLGEPQDDSEILNKYAAVSLADIKSIAADLINGGPPTIAAIGPKADIMSNETFADLLTKGKKA